MNFEFAGATHVIFGAGESRRAGMLAARFGNRALLVCGRSPERAAVIEESLRAQDIACIRFEAGREPTLDSVSRAASLAGEENCDLVVAVGGGSVIDTGKAAAALSTNPEDPLDYLEVIGGGNPLTAPPLPFLALPTTAGTGAEVTRNAVISSPEHGVKVSLRSPLMYPTIALVDPLLTLTLPPALTASTGLDALTQLIEPFVSVKANPLTDALCREGLARARTALPRAFTHGRDKQAREDMSLASLFSGLALSNAGLGAVHGFAGPLGGMMAAAHGAICAALLAPVTRANLKALRARDPDSPLLARFDELGRLLTADPKAGADNAADWLENLCAALKAPSLGRLGLAEKDLPAAVEGAKRANSMKGNPVALTDDELLSIIEAAY
jgi:alcohol dehydrogenase class IV